MRSKALVVALALLTCAPALAGEPDDYYPWRRPIRDGTEAVNALVNDEIDRVLRKVNRGRWREKSCGDVSRELVFPFTLVEYRFAFRARSEFNLDRYRGSRLRFRALVSGLKLGTLVDIEHDLAELAIRGVGDLGLDVLVQVVKDPLGTKGARLTTFAASCASA